jgi:hypothetical protein
VGNVSTAREDMARTREMKPITRSS